MVSEEQGLSTTISVVVLGETDGDGRSESIMAAVEGGMRLCLLLRSMLIQRREPAAIPTVPHCHELHQLYLVQCHPGQQTRDRRVAQKARSALSYKNGDWSSTSR